jgi:hypothetical protein
MAFSVTAAYFERRAAKAKFEDRRRELAETAKFYRQLANITPTFPVGYTRPALGYGADRLDQWAKECRAMADLLPDPECKDRMLRLAHTYDGK